MPKEPQSYGSQEDWVSGNVGETVNRQKSEPDPKHDDFYDSRRSSESTGEHQGGHVSAFQEAESAEPRGGPAVEEAQPIPKVSDQKSGAKRGGYFKDRDYR